MLEVSGYHGNGRVIVINSLGQNVMDKSVSFNRFYEENINLENAQPGLYFVKVVGEGLNETRKVLVK